MYCVYVLCNLYIFILGVLTLTHAINLNILMRLYFLNANESCDKVCTKLLPVIEARKVIYYCVMRVQRTSVARVAAQVAAGYFENIKKITFSFSGCVFLGYFWCTVAAQSIYRQIKIKIDPFTNVYYTWNVCLAA